MRCLVLHTRFAESLATDLKKEFGHAEFLPFNSIEKTNPLLKEIDVCIVAREFPDGLFAQMPNLKWIQLTGVGYEHVHRGLPAPGVTVTNAGALPSLAVAEFIFSKILMLSKGLPQLLTQQQMHEWKLPNISLMKDLSVTVLGTGNIGSQLAKLLNPMGTKVIGVNRSGLQPIENPFSKIVKLKDATDELTSTDYLVVAVPSAPDTVGLVSSELMRQLKPDARIISVSRQNVLDLAAVVERLDNNLLASASLDTFDDEPLMPNHPLWTQKNLFVTPHCAFYYRNHYRDLVHMISRNFRNFCSNTTLANVVEI